MERTCLDNHHELIQSKVLKELDVCIHCGILVSRSEINSNYFEDEEREETEEEISEYEERQWEREQEERAECHCGAYQIIKGEYKQVADCYC